MATAERPTLEPAHATLPDVVTPPVPPSDVPLSGSEAGPRWKFTPEQLLRMAAAGVFREKDRVELIDGDVIVMSPVGRPHTSAAKRLNILLTETFGRRAMVSVGDPVHLDDHSEPESDLALLHWRDDFYISAHPGPADIHVVVELMDTSAAYDRGPKLKLYARARVPEVWLVDLNRDSIETYRRPANGAYDEYRRFARGESLAPGAFPDDALAVDAILGPPGPPAGVEEGTR